MNLSSRSLPLLALPIVLAFADRGQAASVALGTSGDTYVQVGTSTANGTTAGFQVKKDDSGGAANLYNRYGMLTFNLAAGDSLGTLLDAQLKITFGATYGVIGTTFRVYGVVDGGATETFDEATINYNNWGHGTASDSFGFVTTGLTDLGTFSSGTGATGTTITLTGAALVGFLNSDTNNTATFIIARDNVESTAFATFGTKETTTIAQRPSLVLSNVAVPEPGATLLGFIGLAGTLVRRRR